GVCRRADYVPARKCPGPDREWLTGDCTSGGELPKVRQRTCHIEPRSAARPELIGRGVVGRRRLRGGRAACWGVCKRSPPCKGCRDASGRLFCEQVGDASRLADPLGVPLRGSCGVLSDPPLDASWAGEW